MRGPWVTRGYFQGEGGPILDADGFFDTGDVATIDADGYMQITDRSKDVIKSGGEWISSIEIENAAIGHAGGGGGRGDRRRTPEMAGASAADLVRKSGKDVTRDEMLRYLEGKVAKWWLPDDVVFVERDAAYRDRQAPEDPAARNVQGLSAAMSAMALRCAMRPCRCGLAWPALCAALAGCGEPKLECEQQRRDRHAVVDGARPRAARRGRRLSADVRCRQAREADQGNVHNATGDAARRMGRELGPADVRGPLVVVVPGPGARHASSEAKSTSTIA